MAGEKKGKGKKTKAVQKSGGASYQWNIMKSMMVRTVCDNIQRTLAAPCASGCSRPALPSHAAVFAVCPLLATYASTALHGTEHANRSRSVHGLHSGALRGESTGVCARDSGGKARHGTHASASSEYCSAPPSTGGGECAHAARMRHSLAVTGSGTSLPALSRRDRRRAQDESGIAEFVDPNKWLTYFPPLGKSDLQVAAGLPGLPACAFQSAPYRWVLITAATVGNACHDY